MEKRTDNNERGERSQKRAKKLTGYGLQLAEKQKVKEIYGVRERQFRRFFTLATKGQQAAGESLLSILERRLDNVIFRLKLASTRAQARQIIVHGHILVNNKKVYSPSYLVEVDDLISLAQQVFKKEAFMASVIDKRVSSSAKVAEWLELDKADHKGRVLRLPVRADIQTPIEEHLIVELYSK